MTATHASVSIFSHFQKWENSWQRTILENSGYQPNMQSIYTGTYFDLDLFLKKIVNFYNPSSSWVPRIAKIW